MLFGMHVCCFPAGMTQQIWNVRMSRHEKVLYPRCCQAMLMVLQVRAQGGCLGLQVTASLLVIAAIKLGTCQLCLDNRHLLKAG